MEKEILEFLNENNGHDYRELIDLLIKIFPDPIEGNYISIYSCLLNMQNNNLITFRTRGYPYASLGKPVTVPGKFDGTQKQLTLKYFKEREELNLEAMITSAGRKELYEMIFKDSLEAVNQSVIDTNTFQRKIGWRTLIVAGLSFLAIAVSAYYSSKSVTGEQLLQLKTIQQDNNSLLNKMQQSQKAIDSSLRLMAKDSLKKILILKKP